MRKHCILFFALAALLAPLQIFGEDRPTDQVKATTDKLVAILREAKRDGEAAKAERRQQILQEIDRRFDWPSIARGCLGRHWSKASPEQRQEFLDLFRRFLERTYLEKIEPYYDELLRIEYRGEKIIDNFASVKTVITTKQSIDHPVEYRLEKSPAGDWKIYDAVIEGVSLVKNYRLQFDEIISKSSLEDLLKDLRTKVASSK